MAEVFSTSQQHQIFHRQAPKDTLHNALAKRRPQGNKLQRSEDIMVRQANSKAEKKYLTRGETELDLFFSANVFLGDVPSHALHRVTQLKHYVRMNQQPIPHYASQSRTRDRANLLSKAIILNARHAAAKSDHEPHMSLCRTKHHVNVRTGGDQMVSCGSYVIVSPVRNVDISTGIVRWDALPPNSQH